MSGWHWLLVAVGVLLALSVLFIAVLLATGRRSDAPALAGLSPPDCLVLFRALLSDPRVSTGRKLLVAAMVAYLVMPSTWSPTSSRSPVSWTMR